MTVDPQIHVALSQAFDELAKSAANRVHLAHGEAILWAERPDSTDEAESDRLLAEVAQATLDLDLITQRPYLLLPLVIVSDTSTGYPKLALALHVALA